MLTRKEERTVLRSDNVSLWVRLRRFFRVYNYKEKQALFYANAIKRVSDAIITGTLTVTKRPAWMRYTDYTHIRKLQQRVDKRNKNGKARSDSTGE